MNFPVNCGTVKKAYQLLILVLIPRWRSNRRAGEKWKTRQLWDLLERSSKENRLVQSSKPKATNRKTVMVLWVVMICNHRLAKGCSGERGDPTWASRGQEGRGGGVQGTARDGGEHQTEAALEVCELEHESNSPTIELSSLIIGRGIYWPSNIGESERLKRRPKKNITGGRKLNIGASKEYICSHCRQLMLAKFAEDDKLEQMNAQKRRMK